MKALVFAAALMAAGGALAATPAVTRAEVAQLLASVEQSQCKFERNGSWHDAKSARLHLQKKFEYLDGKDLLPNAESFIERGASKSSVSGKAYQMLCKGADAVPSAAWMMQELKRVREAKAK